MSYKLVMWDNFVNTYGELSHVKLVRFRFAVFITSAMRWSSRILLAVCLH